jgi:hypothetical protein
MRDVTRDPKYRAANAIPFSFHEGDRVAKRGGDYSFVGVVLAAFSKRSGSPRYAVENDDGLIHIFNGEQLMLVPDQQEESQHMFTVNDKGIITSPGKFEGQPIWLPAFYSYVLDSCDDGLEEAEGGLLVSLFLITDEDRQAHPTLPADKCRLRIWCDTQGFVRYELS